MTITKNFYALPVLFVVVFCLSACQPGPRVIFSEAEDMPALASPVYLEEDTTLVFLQDFFKEESLPLIDSVSGPGLLGFQLTDGNKELEITVLSPAIPKVSVATIWISELPYALLLENQSLEEYSFIFEPGEEDHDHVALIGDMNNWDATANILEKQDGVWETRLKIAPGRYQYLLSVNGEQITDPANPKVFENHLTGKASLFDAGEVDPQRNPFLFPVEAGNHSLTIGKENNLEELIVLWENFHLPRENVSRHGDHFHIHLPGDVYKKGTSVLRLKGYNLHGPSNLLFILLENGKPLSYKNRQTAK